MKNNILFGALFLASSFMFGQNPVGIWKTIDDKTGKEKSYVEIYQNSKGEIEGKVTKILTPGLESSKCKDCKGANKDKAILGLKILTGLKKDGEQWSGGTILDPNSGKEYKAKMKLNGNDKLEVRGFIGFSLIGRTQTWYKVK